MLLIYDSEVLTGRRLSNAGVGVEDLGRENLTVISRKLSCYCKLGTMLLFPVLQEWANAGEAAAARVARDLGGQRSVAGTFPSTILAPPPQPRQPC